MEGTGVCIGNDEFKFVLAADCAIGNDALCVICGGDVFEVDAWLLASVVATLCGVLELELFDSDGTTVTISGFSSQPYVSINASDRVEVWAFVIVDVGTMLSPIISSVLSFPKPSKSSRKPSVGALAIISSRSSSSGTRRRLGKVFEVSSSLLTARRVRRGRRDLCVLGELAADGFPSDVDSGPGNGCGVGEVCDAMGDETGDGLRCNGDGGGGDGTGLSVAVVVVLNVLPFLPISTCLYVRLIDHRCLLMCFRLESARFPRSRGSRFKTILRLFRSTIP